MRSPSFEGKADVSKRIRSNRNLTKLLPIDTEPVFWQVRSLTGAGFDDLLDLSLSLATFSSLQSSSEKEAEVQDKCVKKRTRPKRRSIYCPVHGCYLDSCSKKYYVFADDPDQLRAKGINRSAAQTLIKFHTTVSIAGEWIEAFWCDRCQATQWYYVCKTGDRLYEVSPAPHELWQRVAGVVHPNGNPSVGEFTRTQARLVKYQGVKAFNTIS